MGFTSLLADNVDMPPSPAVGKCKVHVIPVEFVSNNGSLCCVYAIE